METKIENINEIEVVRLRPGQGVRSIYIEFVALTQYLDWTGAHQMFWLFVSQDAL